MFFSEKQQNLLKEKLQSNVVKVRQGLSYIEGWHAVDEANRIFGFGMWSSEIVSLKHIGDIESDNGKGKIFYKTAYLAEVRVTVRNEDGQENTNVDVGFGNAMGYSEAGVLDNHENAAKEAVTDAMKRALRLYGNKFGNALYDKTQANVEKSATFQDIVNVIQGITDATKQAEAKEFIKTELESIGVAKISDAPQDIIQKIYNELNA